ncbi:MAG: HD domain-containing phosphohydrolase [Desulfobacterales bacterium]
MRHHTRVNLGNLALSISEAMDLASPLLINHQQRAAFTVWEKGKAAGLSEKRLGNVFSAALLHDIGALSLEEKVALRNFEFENIEEHGVYGQLLLQDTPWLREATGPIRFHHRDWRQWDEPIETPLVFDSQLLFLADFLERAINREQYILHQHEDIISKINSLAGSSIHPDVVDLFTEVSEREEFWLDLVSPRLYSLLFNEGPFRKTELEFDDLCSISELFRNIIDFRSRFTATHSSGVAASAFMLARIFGLAETEVELMEVAGNLHDLGKLAIPNSILEKPGKLTRKEMAVMKSHTYYTYSIINTIGGLQQIAQWAAYHHERLDGSGYPFHCIAPELCTGARIMMVADMFTALAEDRPYRKVMSKDQIIKIIKQFSDTCLLDDKIAGLLFENYEEISSYTAERQAMARDFYEKQLAPGT